METPKETLVVWHRQGKEHSAHAGFRKNSDATVEKPLAQSGLSDRAIGFYLLDKGCAIIEDSSPRVPDRWFWYIHVASITARD